jgi:membrane protease YdiL (CAAX protease family)
VLGLMSNALGGVMYGAAFVRTGRIWMPIGLHTTWNWMQGPVFGLTISGATEWSDKLVHQTAVGSDLITGGAYAEGSLVVIAFRFAVIALVVLATRRALGSARDALGSSPKRRTLVT